MKRLLAALLLVLLAALAPVGRAGAQPVDIAADRLIGSRTAEGEVILLQGNVVLRRGTTVVHSQQGEWIKARRTVTLTGGVFAVDGTMNLTADQADYQESSDLIRLTGNVHVVDTGLDATSQFGSYDARSKTAEMWGLVRGVDRGRRLRAEHVSYAREAQVAVATGNVWAADSSGTLELTAAQVRYDRRAQRARAVGAPQLVRTDKGRRTLLTGDTLTVDTERKIAWADGKVHVVRDTLEATAGHAVYWDAEDRGLLTGHPVARNREVESTGDSIEVFTKENEIQSATVRGAARIDFRNTDPAARGERNTLTAPLVHVYFSGGRVDSLYAQGGAVNAYEGPPQAGRLPERNTAHGDQIAVYFGEDRIQRAVLTGKPAGEYRFDRALADSARDQAEAVSYQGVRIDYLVPERRIRVAGNAQLSYEDLVLNAGRVDFDSQKQTLIARDHPTLKDKDEELRGRTMTYDLERAQGTVYHAAVQYDQGFYRGEAIQRMRNDVLQVRDASYTTCDLDHPHYHVAAGRMKIMLRDKIIARPLVFYLKNIPLFALPFYVMPIKPDRHSGLLFPQTQLGFSAQDGRFIRNLGYYWAPNEFMDFTLSGDYYEKQPSWIVNTEARYKYREQVYGQVDARYTNSLALLGQRQYNLNLTHSQTLGSLTRLTAEGHFTSSRDFTRDPRTGLPLANRLDRFLISSVALNRRLSFGTLNAFLSRREDLDTDPAVSSLPRLAEDLPIVSLAAFQRTIGRAATKTSRAFLPFLSSTYYNFNFRAVNHRELRTVFAPNWDTTLVGGEPFAIRAKRDSSSSTGVGALQGGVSDNRRLFGFLTVSPNLNLSSAAFSRDVRGTPWEGGMVYTLGLSSSATFYGTFHPGIAGIRGIRHILFPQVSYTYQPNFPGLTFRDTLGVLRNRFPNVGGVGLSGFRQSQLSYSLQHRFQVRVKTGNTTLDMPDLITVVSSGNYDFLWRRDGLSTPWRPIVTTFRLQPPRFVSLNGTVTHALAHKPYFQTFTIFADLRLSGTKSSPVGELPLDQQGLALAQGEPLAKGPWNVSLTYSYTSARTAGGGWRVSRTGNSYVSFSPTPKWYMTYYNTVDLNARKIQAQEYAVERDLHCWRARFIRRFTADNESEYFFSISIVQQPEVKIGLGSPGLGGYSSY